MSALDDAGVDPDVDLRAARRRQESARRHLPVLAVIAVGGALGGCMRYAAERVWPAVPGGFAWTTWWINLTGCALIGVLMVVITEEFVPHRLWRPFLGVGLLGGFTTFSTYVVDTLQVDQDGATRVALLSLAAIPITAVLATHLAVLATRALARVVRTRP